MKSCSRKDRMDISDNSDDFWPTTLSSPLFAASVSLFQILSPSLLFSKDSYYNTKLVVKQTIVLMIYHVYYPVDTAFYAAKDHRRQVGAAFSQREASFLHLRRNTQIRSRSGTVRTVQYLCYRNVLQDLNLSVDLGTIRYVLQQAILAVSRFSNLRNVRQVVCKLELLLAIGGRVVDFGVDFWVCLALVVRMAGSQIRAHHDNTTVVRTTLINSSHSHKSTELCYVLYSEQEN